LGGLWDGARNHTDGRVLGPYPQPGPES